MSSKLRPDESLVSPREAVAAYSRFLESLDTPVSLSVFIQLKHGSFVDVVNRKINPKDYCCAASFKKDYQAVKGLAKADFLETGIDRKAAAMLKFWEAERVCGETNKRFDSLMYDGGLVALSEEDPRMSRMLLRVRDQVHKILGEPPLSADEGRFGPGATSLVKRDVTLPQKYSRVIHVTPELKDRARLVVGPLWAKEIEEIQTIHGSSVTFVPKDAKTDRAIAIEPHVNVYAQLALGKSVRTRLRKWIDLDTGQEINRFLASRAHDWRLSTIDLSSASDTIARSLVWFLLPEGWADVLDLTRSHRFSLDGKIHEYEKFSSMGNGFTFELETVIFYACALAAGSHPKLTACYGDDIIAEASVYDDLVRLLEYCGFSVNLDKSFQSGSFFESCGEDYFDGVNVRPFQWKDLKPASVYKYMNDISRYALCSLGRDRSYLSAYSFLFSVLRQKRSVDWSNCLIPKGYGDVGIWADFDQATPSRARKGWCGFIAKAMKFEPYEKSYAHDVGGYLSSLDTMALTSSSPVRKRGVYKVRNLITFGDWVGPGPWVSNVT